MIEQARDERGHRQVFHHYLLDRRSQTRGVTAFAPMADTADHWDDLQFANLVAASVQCCNTILCEWTPEPRHCRLQAGDHSETREAGPDNETRTLNDIARFWSLRVQGRDVERFRPDAAGAAVLRAQQHAARHPRREPGPPAVAAEDSGLPGQRALGRGALGTLASAASRSDPTTRQPATPIRFRVSPNTALTTVFGQSDSCFVLAGV